MISVPSGIPLRSRLGITAISALMLALGACSAPLSPRDAASVADAAFVFGAPLVTTIRTMQALAPVSPANRLTWQTTLAGPQSRLVVAPNRDTLYVGAPMDLRAGPSVLEVPAIVDRYYAFQFLDAYTENDAVVGTRTNNGAPATYFIAPPGYTGPTPDGMHRIAPKTLQFFLLGRFAVRDEADIATVLQYRDQVRLQSLSEYHGGPAPRVPGFGAPSGPPQALAASGLAFFDELGADMAINPPTTTAGQRLARRMAHVGIGPGMTPSTSADAATRRALERGLAAGVARVARAAHVAGDVRDGWSTNPRVGVYGDDFLLRAAISSIGCGANVAEEATYAFSRVDASGAPYDGTKAYTVTFPAGALPPTDAFWSVSVYGPDLFFVENAANRYTANSSHGLVANVDGSLTLTFSATPPGDPGPNWVPVPAGPFVLMFRNYLPMAGSASAAYHPPAVQAQ
jgi:hypothetical protein